jgi:hydroxyethylthiazole kinase
MIKSGLIDETIYLEKKYTRAPNCMSSIGIVETLEYLDGKIDKKSLEDKIIQNTLNLSSNTKGADASKEDLESIDNTLNIAKELANKLSLVVAITGETDVISDGKRVVTIKNGNYLLPYITGTGCMCSSLVASYCGASNDKIFEATVLGVITMGIAGEIAYENSNNKGLGTFHKELFNAISNFNKDILIKKANFQEIK